MMCRTNDAFWKLWDQLLQEHKIVIDRPRGSRHPKYNDYIYPLDYGYLEGTSSSDNAGIDVWCGNSEKKIVTAAICSVDYLKKDSEIKILYACTDADIERIIQDHNRSHYMKGIVIKREVM